jgi:hypothetical protein
MTGVHVISASNVGTIVFVIVTVAAVAAPDAFVWLFVPVSLAMLLLGSLAFLRTIFLAAERSRHETLSVAGLWLLSGSAPTSVRRLLLGALAVQVVTALVGASVRPFTALAFGVLAPVYGLGLCGLWAAIAGAFPAKEAGG